MARNGTFSSTIEKYFKDNPGKTVTVGTLMRIAKCGKPAVSSSISYLNSKVRNAKGGIAIETIKRGQSWAYYPDRQPTVSNQEAETSSKRVLRRLANKLEEPNKISPTLTVTLPTPDWAEAEQAFQAQKKGKTFTQIGQTLAGEPLVQADDDPVVFKVVPI